MSELEKLRAENSFLRATLEEITLAAYPDSDKASLFEWARGRAAAALASLTHRETMVKEE